jgi:hypothetical protein
LILEGYARAFIHNHAASAARSISKHMMPVLLRVLQPTDLPSYHQAMDASFAH